MLKHIVTLLAVGTNVWSTPIKTDECSDRCLWIADGLVGTCEWLLDTSKPVIYNQRDVYCNNGLVTGCQNTCSIVNQQLQSTTTASTPPAAASSVTVESECVDDYITFNNLQYECHNLQQPDSDIFNKRVGVCSRSNRCCITCKAVENEKPLDNGYNAVIQDSNQIVILEAGTANKADKATITILWKLNNKVIRFPVRYKTVIR